MRVSGSHISEDWMSEVITAAVAALNERLNGSFAGLAKFVIEGEGAVMLDAAGARAADEAADVTLTADAETFDRLEAGELRQGRVGRRWRRRMVPSRAHAAVEPRLIR